MRRDRRRDKFRDPALGNAGTARSPLRLSVAVAQYSPAVCKRGVHRSRNCRRGSAVAGTTQYKEAAAPYRLIEERGEILVDDPLYRSVADEPVVCEFSLPPNGASPY